MRRKLAVAGAAIGIAATAFAGPVGAANVVKVDVVNEKYKPATAKAKVGQKVKWIGKQGKHSVTFFDMGFDKVVKKGDSVAKTFKVEGDWGYYCRFHSGMEGAVRVTG